MSLRIDIPYNNDDTTYLDGTGAFSTPGGGSGGNPGGALDSIQYQGGPTTFGGITMTNGQILVGVTSNPPSAVAMSGDATIAVGGGVTVSSTGGVSFAASATTDTTNGSNISSGTVVAARLPADVAYLDANQAWTKAQAVTPVALSDASPIAVDASLGNVFTVTLAHTTGTRQLANPTNLKAGQTLTFIISQDTTGGAALTYGSYYKWPGGTPPTVSSGVSAKSVVTCMADTTTTLMSTSMLGMA